LSGFLKASGVIVKCINTHPIFTTIAAVIPTHISTTLPEIESEIR
jgi:hypothetical protein